MSPILIAILMVAVVQAPPFGGVADAVPAALELICAIPETADDAELRRRGNAAGFAFWGPFHEAERSDGVLDVRRGADACMLDLTIASSVADGIDRVLIDWARARGLDEAADDRHEGVTTRERWLVNGGRLSWSATPSAKPEEPTLIHVIWRPRT